MRPFLSTVYLAFFLSLTIPASAQDQDSLASLKPDHPRVLVEPGQWAAIQAQANKDPLLARMLEQLIADADRLMELPPLERKKQGRRLLTVSRQALSRISIWSMARHLTGDTRYAERAEQEMRQLVQFKDWNPSHFLDVGEMTAAVGIGYDWLYHDLGEEARKVIREGLIRHGIQVGVDHIRKGAWWATTDINWNQVCLGGLTVGALAVADEAPELAGELLEAARSGIANGLTAYAPDGVYPEGPGYWSYGTVYQCMMIDAVRSALGTSWEMDKAPGFMESAQAQLHQAGPTGRFFNFSDGREGPSLQPAMFWFARELKKPRLLYQQWERLEERIGKSSVGWSDILLTLWWPIESMDEGPSSLPLAWFGDGHNPIAVFRSSWSDPDAVYLACKAGKGSLSHAHLDAGSFVLEANGVRWASDLGMQSYYDLESKGIHLWDDSQDGSRWSVFRLNNRSHNTLTINDQLHRVDGLAEFTHFDNSSAEIDLSEVFRGQAEKVWRRFELSNRKVTITDHLQGLKPGAKVRWTMATRAKVRIDGKQATLKSKGETLKVRMDPSSDGQLRVIPADPPDDGFNAPNPGTYLLIVDAVAPASGAVNIELHFDPCKRKVIQHEGSSDIPVDRLMITPISLSKAKQLEFREEKEI